LEATQKAARFNLIVGGGTGCTGNAQGIWETKSFRSLKPSCKNLSAPMFLLIHFGDERVFVSAEPAETMGQKKNLAIHNLAVRVTKDQYAAGIWKPVRIVR